MGVVAKTIKQNIEKFIQLVSEPWKGYNRNALLYTAAGDDSVPLKDERLILVKVDGTGKYVAVGVLTPSQGAKPGEKILFSRDPDGKITGKLSFLNDGTVKLENEKDVIEDIKGKKAETIKGDNTVNIKGKFYTGNTAQNACKLWLGFIDLIIKGETFGPPPKHKFTPGFIQQLMQYKEQVKALYKESE